MLLQQLQSFCRNTETMPITALYLISNLIHIKPSNLRHFRCLGGQVFYWFSVHIYIREFIVTIEPAVEWLFILNMDRPNTMQLIRRSYNS